MKPYFCVKKEKLLFLTTLVLFRGLLDALYVKMIVPYFAYEGYRLDLNLPKYFESWVLIIITSLLLRERVKKPSEFFPLLMFLGVLIPLLSLYGLADKPRFTVYSVLLGYSIVVFVSRIPFLKIPSLSQGYCLGLFIALGGCLVVSAWFVLKGGLAHFNLDLSKVYDFRRETGSLLYVGLMAYLINWGLNVFSLSLFASALYKKSYCWAVIIYIMQIFFFGVTSHKATLFYPGLALMVYAFFRNSDKLKRIPLAYCGILVLSYFLSSVSGSLLYVSLILRRVFFTIANNTFDYYIFFSRNPKVYWSNGIMSAFIKYPYDLDPAKVIGAWRFTESHVNNTFLSTGYMQAGIWGVVFYAVLCGVLFRLIDELSKRSPVWFSLAIVIAPMFSLITSADLFTALLTHGVAVSCLMLWLLSVPAEPRIPGNLQWSKESRASYAKAES